MSFSVKQLPEPYSKILDRVFKKEGCLREYNPGKCLHTPALQEIEQSILDFEVRHDDIWFVSYPRTGKK